MEQEPKYKVGQTVDSIYCQQFKIAGYDPEARFFPYMSDHGRGYTEGELMPEQGDDGEFTEEDADRLRDEARSSIAELEDKIKSLKRLEWLMDTMFRGPAGSGT